MPYTGQKVASQNMNLCNDTKLSSEQRNATFQSYYEMEN